MHVVFNPFLGIKLKDVRLPVLKFLDQRSTIYEDSRFVLKYNKFMIYSIGLSIT